jgi:hypothetical protein
MAKIVTENIIVSISRLEKEHTSSKESVINEALLSSIEQVVEELIGDGVVVEAVDAGTH